MHLFNVLCSNIIIQNHIPKILNGKKNIGKYCLLYTALFCKQLCELYYRFRIILCSLNTITDNGDTAW